MLQIHVFMILKTFEMFKSGLHVASKMHDASLVFAYNFVKILYEIFDAC